MRIALPSLTWLVSGLALASVSILTGSVFPGGDLLRSSSPLYRTLENGIRSLALSAGEVCYQTEHHVFSGGLTHGRVYLIRSFLEDEDWEIEELRPFSYSRKSAVWLAHRKKVFEEAVLIVLLDVEGTGFLSICKID